MRDEAMVDESGDLARELKYGRAMALMGMVAMSTNVAVVAPGRPKRSSINPSSRWSVWRIFVAVRASHINCQATLRQVVNMVSFNIRSQFRSLSTFYLLWHVDNTMESIV